MERSDGVKMHPETNPIKVEKQANGLYTVHTKTLAGVEETITDCDEVLMAAGRHANVWELGLEAAGVAMEGNKVKVDQYNKTTCDNIYAIGACLCVMSLWWVRGGVRGEDNVVVRRQCRHS